MGEPFSTAAFGSIGSTITLLRFVYDIKNTPVDVKTFLDLVHRVDEDLQYAVSLRGKHLKQLSESPIELRRLDGIIASATESILDVGRLLEPCRKEANGGKVPMMGRIKWVLGDSTAIARRTANLQQQHAAINVEIAYLRNLESLRPLKDLASNISFENMDFFSSRGRSSSRSSVFGNNDLQPPPRYSQSVPDQPVVQAIPEETYAYELASDTRQSMTSVEYLCPIPPYNSRSPSGRYPLSIPEVNVEMDNEDPEDAYFRGLRRKEEERRRRRAASGRN